MTIAWGELTRSAEEEKPLAELLLSDRRVTPDRRSKDRETPDRRKDKEVDMEMLEAMQRVDEAVGEEIDRLEEDQLEVAEKVEEAWKLIQKEIRKLHPEVKL